MLVNLLLSVYIPVSINNSIHLFSLIYINWQYYLAYNYV